MSPTGSGSLIRTFVLAGLGSGLSIAIYALFILSVGVGAKSDSFFAVLAVTQTLGTILFAPYESFAQRLSLDSLRRGEEPVWPLLITYLALSMVTLVPYYLVGERLLGPLFASAYGSEPELWRHHFHVLGALIPLTGMVAMLQVYCQARQRYDLPKVGLVVGRVVAIALLLVSGSGRVRVISSALVLSHIIAVLFCWSAVGIKRLDLSLVLRTIPSIFAQWLHVNKWSLLLKTDGLVERMLAAHVKTGFLSLFSLGWSVVMSVVEAYQSSYVVADSNQYYSHWQRSTGVRAVSLLKSEYHRSSVAALWLTGGLTAAFLGAVVAIAITGQSTSRGGSLTVAELSLLAATLSAAQYVLLVWKQLAGVYTIQGRAAGFAKYLTLVYLCLVGPRIVMTWALGAVGFCLGLVAYYASQVIALGHFVTERASSAAAAGSALESSSDPAQRTNITT